MTPNLKPHIKVGKDQLGNRVWFCKHRHMPFSAYAKTPSDACGLYLRAWPNRQIEWVQP